MRFLNKLKIPLSALLLVTFANSAEIDKETGLILSTGFEEVKNNCTVCHSAAFIIHQKGDRDTWHAMIVWMQKTQGLWEFDKETEDKILTYLATNYPPGASSRRDNLKPQFLPTNPYQ
ncbi:hypothetical protein [Arcobacter sp. FWKO B]|uniref:hypothetical protein n=1 Tax=Arcobacter sp. FWKO B TaxID=2593672 RepID=UPI0018A4BF9D|nr:hypothetical protein [Arcobacter sp. FWKO B]QOG13160.1 hypothetical protein FWKOB_10865 [Arcobacter sp. FWKO B]